jgi:hypothetical protein
MAFQRFLVIGLLPRPLPAGLSKGEVMTQVLPVQPTEATPDVRRIEFARMLAAKLEQGWKIESQRDTDAILTMRGRKRLFRGSVDCRQSVSVDELGVSSFEKLDRASG